MSWWIAVLLYCAIGGFSSGFYAGGVHRNKYDSYSITRDGNPFMFFGFLIGWPIMFVSLFPYILGRAMHPASFERRKVEELNESKKRIKQLEADYKEAIKTITEQK